MAADLRVEWLPEQILVLTIDRPERRNVLDHELLAELATTLRNEQGRAAAVILRGAGDAAFSSGFDLRQLDGSEADLEADASLGRAAEALLSCPVPVLAQIRGHCHGGGVELALSCDLRIAADDMQLSLRAVSLGVVYRYEFVARLVQLCGLGRASDLLLGMDVLPAAQALSWGLVTEVIPAAELEERTLLRALALGRAPAAAVEGTKASLLVAARQAVTQEAVERALVWRRRAARSPERRAALAAAQTRLGRRSRPTSGSPQEAE